MHRSGHPGYDDDSQYPEDAASSLGSTPAPPVYMNGSRDVQNPNDFLAAGEKSKDFTRTKACPAPRIGQQDLVDELAACPPVSPVPQLEKEK